MTKAAEHQRLGVKWSLERLAEGGEDTMTENATFLWALPSNQESAVVLREAGAVLILLEALRRGAWGPHSHVPTLLLRIIVQLITMDEAACGQARLAAGPTLLTLVLQQDRALAASADASADRAEKTVLLLRGLIALADVDFPSQIAIAHAGGVGLCLEVLQPPSVQRAASLELLAELQTGILAPPVFLAFAVEVGRIVAHLNSLLARQLRTFGIGELVLEEAAMAGLLLLLTQQAAPPPGWRLVALGGLLSNINTLVKCGGNRLGGETPLCLANAVLHLVGAEPTLADHLRSDPDAFELLRRFEGAVTLPQARVATGQLLGNLKSFALTLEHGNGIVYSEGVLPPSTLEVLPLPSLESEELQSSISNGTGVQEEGKRNTPDEAATNGHTDGAMNGAADLRVDNEAGGEGSPKAVEEIVADED